MSQPSQRVTDYASYNDDFYAQLPEVPRDLATHLPVSNPVGQFDTGGSAYCQVNVHYVNTVPRLDAGTVVFPVTEDTAVKSQV